MKNFNRYIGLYSVYTVVYIVAFVLSRGQYNVLASISLILVAAGLYIIQVKHTGNIVDLKAIFSLSWIGGQGIACLQLSYLQRDWAVRTWISFFLIYIGFSLGYDLFYGKERQAKRIETKGTEDSAKVAKKVFNCIVLITIISTGLFIFEAIVLGFIPLFSDKPHAYSEFNLRGVHYFVVTFVFIPALTIIYSKLMLPKGESYRLRDFKNFITSRAMILLVCNVIAIALPILLVSRFQLLFGVGLGIIVYIIVYKELTYKMAIGCLLFLIPIYVVLSVARNHDVEYLNSIFVMRNENMPIFISQPYIYIANNYENFNLLVEELDTYSLGIRMLNPFYRLSGIQFLYPGLMDMPVFITKTELTTLTMFYDAYYDFGMVGIFVFPLVLGIVSSFLANKIGRRENPIMFLLYGQFVIYLGLSFFTIWFSIPTTWFYFVICVMMYIYIYFAEIKQCVASRGFLP